MVMTAEDYIARVHIKPVLERLTPAVQEVIRKDLIQSVGNFLRHARNEKQDLADLEALTDEMVFTPEWGSF